MVVGSHLDRPLYGRGPSAGLRFTICALLSIVLMYLDAHGHLTQRLRYALQASAYPIQIAVSSPGLAWQWLTQSFETRAQLRSENTRLQGDLHDLQLAAMREESLERENAELRGLRSALPPLIKSWQLAEVIGVETDPLRQRIVIDKGARAGVTVHQAVVDGSGVLGQVSRVGPWSSEVILVTDPAQAIPVQVTRNNLRSVAIGNDGELQLPYLAANADVRNDDLLVSSGLGGVFPSGFPVARVVGIRRDSNQPAQVRAQPLANIGRDREVIVLRFDPENPDAPAAAPAMSGTDKEAAAPSTHPAHGPPGGPQRASQSARGSNGAAGRSHGAQSPPASNKPAHAVGAHE